MKIGIHDVPQPIIQNYLSAIKWNQSHATEESDQGQKDAHNEVLEAAGFDRNKMTDEAVRFSAVIDDLVNNLIIKGY